MIRGGACAVALALLVPLAAWALPPVSRYPAEGDCPPIFLFSNGFGGSEKAYRPLASATAAAGFETWVIGHPQSGPAAFRAVRAEADPNRAIWETILDPGFNQAHLDAIGAVLDHALSLRDCAPPLVVLGGYSIGAQMAMVEAGAATRFGTAGEDRFDAYVAISPPGLGPQFPEDSWAGIDKPVLVVTGSHDGAPYAAWKYRLAAFEGLPATGRSLFLYIDGATHMQLSASTRDPAGITAARAAAGFLAALGAGTDYDDIPENTEVWRR
ncbi:alpha/beta hydrolase family protein [Pseudooceanicola sp. LIPI14-2-Ac024]|uniref:alpha/beta hydrolase family protein n=1 Tax=Pseudooceanicola sp. LIPI14-2-Ac024 TaxID=3344875 RepID=UPI0035CF5A27